jgi:hypothetical protein
MGVCLAGLWRAPHHRTPALVSAALCAPSAGFALLFVPAYWHPKLIVAIPVGVEDVLFSFANGGLAWLMIAGATAHSGCGSTPPRSPDDGWSWWPSSPRRLRG